MSNRTENEHPLFFVTSTLLRRLLLAFLFVGAPAAFGADIVPRVAGGIPSEDGKWPWMTAILERAVDDMQLAPFCGGALIHPSWVLTAAQCVFDELGNVRPPESIDVMVGEIDLLAGGDRIPVVDIIPHPDYEHGRNHNNIALLQLESPAQQEPVQLPGPTYPNEFHHPVVPSGTIATALGWGRPSPRHPIFPSELGEIDLPIVDNSRCQRKIIPSSLTVRETEICAGFASGQKGTCLGDTGGPLIAQSAATDDNPVQVGVTSRVLLSNNKGHCAKRGGYGVYARVSSYSQWITENICPRAARPAAPVIELTLDGNLACLDFAPVAGATGYRLYWTAYPEKQQVFQRDIGDATAVCTTLPSGNQFWVAVDAYNGNCLGPLSNIEPLLVP